MIKNIIITLILLSFSTICFAGIRDDAIAISEKISDSKVMVVNGSSMNPILKNGDVIVVKPIDHSKLKRGMVCVYKNDLGELIAHSVVSTNPLVLKGANNKVVDPDKVVEIVGIMYGVFYNWNGEIIKDNITVLAKKY